MATLDEIGVQVDEIVADTMFLIANQGATDMVTRIFANKLDVNGKSLGGYKSVAYAEYRKSLGLQTEIKDLQLTGSLIRSIEIASTDYGEAIIINNSVDFDKALFQEEQLGDGINPLRIFELSQDEIDNAFRVGDEYFTEKFVDLFNNVKIEL